MRWSDRTIASNPDLEGSGVTGSGVTALTRLQLAGNWQEGVVVLGRVCRQYIRGDSVDSQL